MRLSAPLRIAEIAAMLGWSHRKTLRWLLEGHEASGHTLLEGGPLRNGGARPYTVSIAALRRVFPDVFEPPPGIEARVEESEARQREHEEQLHQMATVIGVLRRQGRPRMSAAA